MINNIITTPRIMVSSLAIGSFLLIAIALFFEYGMGLHPCKMCYWQRYAHYAVLGLGVLSLLPASRPYHRGVIGVMGGALLIGAGIAFWHSGVELKLLPGPASCSAALSLDGNVSTLLDQMLASPPVRCDEVPWSFLGLSMANWNFVITLVMALTAFASFMKTKITLSEPDHD